MEPIVAQAQINARLRTSMDIHSLVTIIDIFYKQYLPFAHNKIFSRTNM